MMGKEGSAWRVRGFLTPPGRSQPSARSRQNLRPRSEARNPETRANWALCRIVAQSRENDEGEPVFTGVLEDLAVLARPALRRELEAPPSSGVGFLESSGMNWKAILDRKSTRL